MKMKKYTRMAALAMLSLAALPGRVMAQTTAVNVVIVQAPSYPQPSTITPAGITRDFAVVTHQFSDFSYGGLQFVNTVLGPFTVTDVALANCDRNSMKAQIAAAYGGPLPAAAKTLYVMPATVRIGGTVSNTDLSGVICDRFGSYVVLNEAWTLPKRFGWSLGGTFGLHRAYAEECGRNTNCIIVTPEGHIGDRFDVMGTGTGMNALERLIAGWLPPANVTTVTQAGTYPLAALEVPLDGQPRVLKIPRPGFTLPAWYVELRQIPTITKAGTITSTSVVLHRMYFNVVTAGLPTVLEDVNPMSVTSHENVDYVLDPGQLFIDPLTGIGIKTVAIPDANSALVQVLFNQPIPVPPPLIIIPK